MLPIIDVSGLGKRYRRGGQQAAYRTLREDFVAALRHPFRRRQPREDTTFWALRDVDLQVNQGEIIGVIGPNGAGKSTLLKILARVTPPTEGQAVLRGRLGSLLEVGTGFHPELTGRENIHLSGTILGMRRTEVSQYFDEIVAFSELERFLDTPVKHYSSGMYVRLAFAVAAHLRSEILLVDEVLAVGDASFQRKCLGKMDDVAQGGRTVLFVSHNMGAVERLCHSAVLVQGGRLVERGPSGEVVARYLTTAAQENLAWERSEVPDLDAYLRRVAVVDGDGCALPVVTTATALRVAVDFTQVNPDQNLMISVGLLDAHGTQIFGTMPEDVGVSWPRRPGDYRAVVQLPAELLMAKPYRLAVALWIPYLGGVDRRDDLSFTVQETDCFAAASPVGRPGFLTVRCGWTVEAA